jgi:hypothetical protein
MPTEAEIIQAGENAKYNLLALANMYKYHNLEKAPYDVMLARIQAAFGPTKHLGNLTDEEVNTFVFVGLGDAASVAKHQSILQGWQSVYAPLDAAVLILPPNEE